MKVLLVSASPRRGGNTFTALNEVKKTLESDGIDTELVELGAKPVRGCIACNGCRRDPDKHRCVFDDDICNAISEKAETADAFVFGAPVYYGVPNATAMALIQRLLYSNGGAFQYKPVANVCVCRRGGADVAYQTMNMMFEMCNMPIVTSQYWNIAYGREKGEAASDTEGMQTMRTLAHNMSWMLKKIHGLATIDLPEKEPWSPMNFIR